MSILAIDPGYTQSAWLLIEDGQPVDFSITPNDDALDVIRDSAADRMAIECVASYGMAVGKEVFETCVWIGRFIQCWTDRYHPLDVHAAIRVYRRDVKLHLCGSARAKDANVRQALIDLYGPGKAKAIGLKATPGPLYGVTSHVWSALAVAVTAEALSAQTGASCP